MSEERDERPYPLRTMHDFLEDLDREWDRFRTGSLIGILVSGALFFFVLRQFILQMIIRPRMIIDNIFLLVVIVLLVYSVYSFIEQHKFFRKWERRMGLLIHLEESLIEKSLKKVPKE